MPRNHKGKPFFTLMLMLFVTIAATVSQVMAEQGQRQRHSQGPQVTAAPLGWVNVGYDYHNDGILDA